MRIVLLRPSVQDAILTQTAALGAKPRPKNPFGFTIPSALGMLNGTIAAVVCVPRFQFDPEDPL